jgi:hypothetical protein
MPDLCDDLIWGAEAIADYQPERGLIPAGKVGDQWVASRRALQDYFAKITVREGGVIGCNNQNRQRRPSN